MFTFGAKQNLTAPAPPVAPEEEGPAIVDLVIERHRAKLAAACEAAFGATGGDAAAVAAAKQDLKAKVDDIVKKDAEVIKQLFYAERAVLDWHSHGFMQEPPARDD
jgi:hypothetical protein